MHAGGKLLYASFTTVWKLKCSTVVIMNPVKMCAQRIQTCSLKYPVPEQRRSALTPPSYFTRIWRRQLRPEIFIACILPVPKLPLIMTSLTIHQTIRIRPLILHKKLPFLTMHIKWAPYTSEFHTEFRFFGIANEGQPVQYNFPIDEHQIIGSDRGKAHNPDAVVSMLHHHLQIHTHHSQSLGLHAENCCVQNIYKAVLAYLA